MRTLVLIVLMLASLSVAVAAASAVSARQFFTKHVEQCVTELQGDERGE